LGTVLVLFWLALKYSFTVAPVVYIGDRLRELREQRAMTQRELARAAGISPNTVAVLERSKAQPNMSTVRKLAQALGVDPSELVKRD
jgi:transcriptional regulator with XRE-family HTH domain